MANITITFLNREGKAITATSVIGKKTTEDSDYTHYHVAKKNEFGIKWVCIGKNGHISDICTEGGKRPNYASLRISL